MDMARAVRIVLAAVILTVAAAVVMGAGELRHKDIGQQMTKAEWEAIDTHFILDGEEGDLLYGTAAGPITRLPLGTAGDVLVVATGTPGIPAWESLEVIAPMPTPQPTSVLYWVEPTPGGVLHVATPTPVATETPDPYDVLFGGDVTAGGDLSVGGNLTATGGIDSTVIGETTAAAADFTTVDTSGALSVGGAATVTGNLAVDTNVLFVNASTNRVGIANASPTVPLDVTGAAAVSGALSVGGAATVTGAATFNGAVSNNATAGLSQTWTAQAGYCGLTQTAYGTDFFPLIVSNKSRGTQAERLPSNSGDELYRIDVHGTTDAATPAFYPAARFRVYQDGDSSATRVPGRFEFDTGSGGTAGLATRMTIKSDGKVGIGTETPAQLLDVAGRTKTTTLQVADYLLPTGDGAANQVMSTDGAGVLSWVAGGGEVTGATALTELSDVSATITPVADAPLVYDGTIWAPSTPIAYTEPTPIVALHQIEDAAELEDAPVNSLIVRNEEGWYAAAPTPMPTPLFTVSENILSIANSELSFVVGEDLTVGNTFAVDDSIGYVGIRETSPAFPLDVDGTSRYTGNAFFQSDLSVFGTFKIPPAPGGTPVAFATPTPVVLPTRTPVAGDYLAWSEGNGRYIPATPTGATTLMGLSDVATATPVVGSVLRHNGTNWGPATLAPAAEPTPPNLLDLRDVNVAATMTPVTGSTLRWDATNWVPATPHPPTPVPDPTVIAALSDVGDAGALAGAQVNSYIMRNSVTNLEGTVVPGWYAVIPTPVATPIPAANPSAVVGGVPTPGIATTYMRSDAAPALANPFTPAGGIQNITGGLSVSGKISSASNIEAASDITSRNFFNLAPASGSGSLGYVNTAFHDSQAGYMIFNRYRGTAEEPAILSSGDWLGSIQTAAPRSGGWPGTGPYMAMVLDGTAGETHIPGRFEFWTGTNAAAPEKRMTIDSGGNVGIGVSPVHRLDVYATGSDYSAVNIFADGGFHTSRAMRIQCGIDNPAGSPEPSIVMHILNGAGGDVGQMIFDNTSLSLYHLSDAREKDNIRKSPLDARSIVAAVPLSRFDKGEGVASESDGFVAQELEVAFPEAVIDVECEDGETRKFISTTKLIPVMWKALQEQDARMDALEARLEKLEARR